MGSREQGDGRCVRILNPISVLWAVALVMNVIPVMADSLGTNSTPTDEMNEARLSLLTWSQRNDHTNQ